MKLLYLTTVLPNNKKTGGEIASFQCIEALRSKHKVDVVAYKRSDEAIKSGTDDHIIEERIIESQTSKLWTIIWLVLSFINKRSFSSQKFYSKKYINFVKKLISQNSYDLIIIEHSQLSWILDTIPGDMPIIFNSQNVEYLIYKELADQSNSLLKKMIYLRESKLMRLEEQTILSKSQQVWVLSSSDKNEYNKLVEHSLINVINIPGGFEQLVECKKKYDIGILGTWSWESNKKGLEWFLQSVLPLIDSKYTIALGGKGSLDYKNLYSNMETLGFVDDAQIFLSSCKVLVIPTTAGGGIQIKTLDAISTNRPIVTTTIGVRGIDSLPDSVYVLDNKNEFATKINQILINQGENENGYNWSQSRVNKFKKSLNELVGRHENI